MSYIDTRDLIERRDDLKQQILDSFIEEFPQYEEMTESFEDIRFEEEEIESWKESWKDEIEEIDNIENNCSEFEFGTTLIEEDDCKELVSDIADLPSWIEIDWEATSENIKQDYSEITYQGKEYSHRD